MSKLAFVEGDYKQNLHAFSRAAIMTHAKAPL